LKESSIRRAKALAFNIEEKERSRVKNRTNNEQKGKEQNEAHSWSPVEKERSTRSEGAIEATQR
jgi:hypothetical protein